jgi:hypothetical protein
MFVVSYQMADETPEVLGVFVDEVSATEFAETEYERMVDYCLQGANAHWWQSITVSVGEVIA